MRIQVPHEKGQAREKGSLIVKYRDIVKYRFSRFCTAVRCAETAERRRNVGITVPRKRALTEVQFGVPVPDRK